MELPDKSATGPPKKKIEPVVKGTQVKRPASRRFFDTLFAESPKALGAKVARDVVVPRIKAGFEEAFNSFLSGMLWGDSSNRPLTGIANRTVLSGGRTNYSAVNNRGMNGRQQAQQALTMQSSGNYQDLVVPTQQGAEILLANMYDLLNQYRVVAVADLYELAEITPSISDNSYGWSTLDGARISKVRDGYLLELPRPTLI